MVIGLAAPTSFRSISADARVEYEVRRSRFIASAARVNNEEGAHEFVTQVASEFRTASHNVFAYRVGLGVLVERYSDDGEPSGTAGPPALEVLKQRDLRNIAVVVTRYFGGIKLGGGGLVRAYSHSAALALDTAREVDWVAYRELRLELDYSLLGRVEYTLREANCPIVGMDYGANVTITFYARHDRLSQWESDLLDLTAGRVTMTSGLWLYLPEMDEQLLEGAEKLALPVDESEGLPEL